MFELHRLLFSDVFSPFWILYSLLTVLLSAGVNFLNLWQNTTTHFGPLLSSCHKSRLTVASREVFTRILSVFFEKRASIFPGGTGVTAEADREWMRNRLRCFICHSASKVVSVNEISKTLYSTWRCFCQVIYIRTNLGFSHKKLKFPDFL